MFPKNQRKLLNKYGNEVKKKVKAYQIEVFEYCVILLLYHEVEEHRE